MEISEYAKMDIAERLDSLQATCEEVIPDFRYSRKITMEEKEGLQDEITQRLATNSDLSEQIKGLNSQKRDNTKVIAENNEIVVAGFVSKKEKVFKVINTESGFFEYINEDGMIVEKERIKGIHNSNIFRNAVNQ